MRMKPENSDLTDKNEIKEYESKWGGGKSCENLNVNNMPKNKTFWKRLCTQSAQPATAVLFFPIIQSC